MDLKIVCSANAKFAFETRSYYITQASLELKIFLHWLMLKLLPYVYVYYLILISLTISTLKATMQVGIDGIQAVCQHVALVLLPVAVIYSG